MALLPSSLGAQVRQRLASSFQHCAQTYCRQPKQSMYWPLTVSSYARSAGWLPRSRPRGPLRASDPRRRRRMSSPTGDPHRSQ